MQSSCEQLYTLQHFNIPSDSTLKLVENGMYLGTKRPQKILNNTDRNQQLIRF
jgi:hypothetical protein